MKIEMDKVAQLARLKMDKERLAEFEKQFQNILEYFSKLQAVNTEGVEPLVTPHETFQNLRADDVEDHEVLATDLLKKSQSVKDRLFVVPPVVGGEE